MNQAIDDAVKAAGTQAKLARAIDVSPVFVSQMRSGVKAVPAELCPRIELATGGQVTREQLRPDIFGPLEHQVIAKAPEEVRKAS